MSRSSQVLTVALVVVIVAPALTAAASEPVPVCPVDFNRAMVEDDIYSGLSPDDISAKYSACVADGVQTEAFSTYYEYLTACGYNPQVKEFDCAVELRQRFGYGGPPANGFGSWEWVYICVDYGLGFTPVNLKGVHVHDESFGIQPPWYYGVDPPANSTLMLRPLNGQTLNARAILSWQLIPNSCTYRPVWGSWFDFKIKLDP